MNGFTRKAANPTIDTRFSHSSFECGGRPWCQAKDKYKTFHGGLDSLPQLPCPLHRWHCLGLLLFLELLASLSRTGELANVNGSIFLPGRRSFLSSEAFWVGDICEVAQENNTVCVWYPAQYALHRPPTLFTGTSTLEALLLSFWIRTKSPPPSLTKDPVSTPTGKFEYRSPHQLKVLVCPQRFSTSAHVQLPLVLNSAPRELWL